jgi:hypothetical protein
VSGAAADLVLRGGTVVTVDAAFTVIWGGAVAVRDGVVVGVGPEGVVADDWVGPDTELLDVRGGAILPGINDSHVHAAMLGAYWPQLWPGRRRPARRRVWRGRARHLHLARA